MRRQAPVLLCACPPHELVVDRRTGKERLLFTRHGICGAPCPPDAARGPGGEPLCAKHKDCGADARLWGEEARAVRNGPEPAVRVTTREDRIKKGLRVRKFDRPGSKLARCQVAGCGRATRSGEVERDRAERWCHHHHPSRLEHLDRIRPRGSQPDRGYAPASLRAHQKDHMAAFERNLVRMRELATELSEESPTAKRADAAGKKKTE